MNNEINDKTYIPLTPFKGWVLENFPFIEADFDAITNYELLCLIVKYLNNVIYNQNQVQELGTELVTAYNQLLNYVNNFFDNLDLSSEVDRKLDKMVEDGTMSEIINQEIFGEINNKLATLDSHDLTHLVVIGDSYTAQSGSNWAELVANQLHLTLVKLATSSMGFVHAVDSKVFVDRLSEINSNIRNKVKYLICYGGINDNNEADFSTVTTAVTNFCTQAKLTCPNAQIIIAGPQIGANQAGQIKNLKCIQAIEKGARDGGVSYVNANDWLINTQHRYQDVYQNDMLHPSTLGYIIIASKMLGVINNSTTGYFSIIPSFEDGFNGDFAVKGGPDYCDLFVRVRSGSFTTGENSVVSFVTPNDMSFMFGTMCGPVMSWNTGQLVGMYKFNKSTKKISIYNTTGSAYNNSGNSAWFSIHIVYNMTEIMAS